MRVPPGLARFLLSGVFNTAVTYGLYLVLLQFLSYRLSYTLTFISGIGIAYLLTRYFVFGKPRSGKRALLFPGIYLAQYILGLIVVSVWVEVAHLNSSFAPLASIAVTIPVTFVLTKWVFGVSPKKNVRP